MKRTASYLCLVLALSAVAEPAAAESIRVAVADNRRSVTVRSSSGLIAENGSAAAPGTTLTVQAGTASAGPLRIRGRKGVAELNGKPYRGVLEVRKKANGLLLVVNELDLEDYLKGVVAAEVPSDWEMEALKAQAVASRTYALYQKRRAGRRSYHILDTVDSQVYLGVRGERPRSTKAVEATRGETIRFQGGPIAAFYHSSCGGRTEDALVLWAIDEPYLKGVDCDCQQISTYGLWEKRFSVASVLNALRRKGYRPGQLRNIESGEITPGGRVRTVLFRSSGGTLSVPAETIRSALGYTRVPSIFFEPELIDGEVVFSGRGNGHGVGMCQWGARELARRGHDHRAILLHYYPGTEIGTMP